MQVKDNNTIMWKMWGIACTPWPIFEWDKWWFLGYGWRTHTEKIFRVWGRNQTHICYNLLKTVDAWTIELKELLVNEMAKLSSSAQIVLLTQRNPVKRSSSPWVLLCLAEWLEHPASITEVMGLIPTWNSEYLFNSLSAHCQATIIEMKIIFFIQKFALKDN